MCAIVSQKKYVRGMKIEINEVQATICRIINFYSQLIIIILEMLLEKKQAETGFPFK